MRGESAPRTVDRGTALLTDGGEAVQEEQDADAEQSEEQGDEQEAEQGEEADGEQEQGAEEETEEDTEETGDERAEEAEEEEDEQAPEESEEGDEEPEEEETEDEDEEPEAEEEGAEDEEGIPEEDEEAEGVHSGGAESVYEGEEATGVLHLDLDGLALDLLGLEVHLDEVVLDVSARPGDNNLVGNLLSAVTGLLDGLAASPMDAIKNAFGKAKDALAGVVPSFGGIKDRLAGLVPDFGGIKNAILGPVPGVGGEGASEEEGEAAAEEEPGDEEDGDESERPGVLARIKGWFGDKLRGALSALPIQEIAANVAREMLRELIEQIESRDRDETQEGGATAEAES